MSRSFSALSNLICTKYITTQPKIYVNEFACRTTYLKQWSVDLKLLWTPGERESRTEWRRIRKRCSHRAPSTVNAQQIIVNVTGCLHDPANVQQTSSKCIQNTSVNAGRLLEVCWAFAAICYNGRREGGVGGLATPGPATFASPAVAQKYKIHQNAPFSKEKFKKNFLQKMFPRAPLRLSAGLRLLDVCWIV